MRVTIGIPFYNCEAFLAAAIKSVIAQTYENWELILVDDGSKDCSLEVAKSFADPRIRVISDGKNRKLSARLNQIISEAKGEYIARMDADDMLDPCRLEKQVRILKENPNIDLVSTGVASISNDNKIRGIRNYYNIKLSKYNMVAGNIGIVHASILARKSWYLRHQYKEGIIAEDYELWNRAYFNNDLNCYKIPEPLYYYREDGNVTYPKLMRAYKNQISIIPQYRKDLSFIEFLKINLKMYLKILIIFILNSLGMLGILLSRRVSEALTDEQVLLIESKIKHILDDF